MAGPRVKYEADRRSMRAFLSSPEMARIVEAVARKGQAAARALAPRDTGDYAGSLKVDVQVYRDRQLAVLYSTSPYAGLIEARERVLGRAVDHMR
ncbi:HK97 gp10 family phage protein [Spirillospora sp. NBC_01491]|uniref:HK97 gp10 family phage protein n=1 Tax=Spirillospora sp. NBC_01491 TaxID=2976007 RepID=UPI002E30F6CF|nr:HK97 gp10 family phage protein [Spirillospora sp. NBC_01491]